MSKLRDVTLVFLLKRSGGEITEICLAMKKRGFGIGRWNGVGGKVDKEGETIIEAAIRETKEEINVTIEKLKRVAELSFYFPHNPAFNQMVHVYFVEEWEGEPTENEEMNPEWFSVENIPYPDMWPDDIFWLPKVLEGNIIKASFEFGEKDIILNKEINIIESFN
jgi:8-oxo-dGTP pyrophosphatase MutT (NUDIX family)